LVVEGGREPKVEMGSPATQFGGREIEASTSGLVVDRQPLDRGGRVVLRLANPPVGQRMRVALDRHHPPIGLRVLDLHPPQKLIPNKDQVEVDVLAEWDRDPVAPLDQVGGDLELGQIPFVFSDAIAGVLQGLLDGLKSTNTT